jgi:hypothetical protein
MILIKRSIIVDDLQARFDTQNYGIAYIYFDSQDQKHQSAVNVFASLLKQFAVHSKVKCHKLCNVYNLHQTRRTYPDLPELVDCIVSVCTQFSSSFIILDAVDESEKSQLRKILKTLNQLIESGRIKCLATGRPHIDDIEIIKFSSTIEIRADVNDLRHYLDNKLMETRFESSLKEQVVEVLTTKANGL